MPQRPPATLRAFGPLALLLVGALSGMAQDAGEVDRRVTDPDERRLGSTAPVDSATPEGELRSREDELFVPEEVELPGLPIYRPPQRANQTEEPSFFEQIELRFEARARTGFGSDSNVFRAERGTRADGFVHARGEVELLAEFPSGSELFAEVTAETRNYFHNGDADEQFGSLYLESFQPVTDWLDAGGQVTLEYSRLNLLNDNGDLLPRGRFGSFDAEPRAYLILRPMADVALESGASYRFKDYDENRGVASLDYTEIRFDTSLSVKLSRDPRARVKLKYRFRRRDYRELRARGRSGLIEPDSPRLDLFRHQLSLTFYQEFEVGEQRVRLIATVGGAYNDDLFQNDRSYREGSLALRAEWWVIPDRTRVDFGLRGVARNFLVRQSTESGGHLRHRLLSVSLGVWQQLGELPLAVYASGRATVWRSGDVGEDYDRYVGEGGVEVFF
ncbi:MAG: hypothetical protein R3F62_00175 [Planctomycetota bacterium]